VNPVDLFEVEGFKIPQGYYSHKGHTWVKIDEGTTVSVGLDDFAMRLFGPFDRIESPLIGKQVHKDCSEIRVTRGSHEAMVLSPVSGVVTAINGELRENGKSAGESPYGRSGWVMNVQSDNLREDLKGLMLYDESRAFFKKEVDKLYHLIEEVDGPMATDGGLLGQDIFGHLPGLGWKRLTGLFLHTP
jgi:glycine cleavage system H lipoate-binding protein